MRIKLLIIEFENDFLLGLIVALVQLELVVLVSKFFIVAFQFALGQSQLIDGVLKGLYFFRGDGRDDAHPKFFVVLDQSLYSGGVGHMETAVLLVLFENEILTVEFVLLQTDDLKM